MSYNIEELLKQLTEELEEYINDKKYVYKICGDFIVILEKLEDTLTNENRSNVSQKDDDKLYAKYRANKLLVKEIINKYDLTKCENVMSGGYAIQIEYKVNETVYPDNFDTNLEEVCSSGIHYFLNLKSAFYYCLETENINGEYLNWYDNGQMYEKCNYVDGKMNGEYLEWYSNGQMMIKGNYVDGKINGELLKWHSNGQIFVKCNYVDGKRNGEYLEWYGDGQVMQKCNYVDGILNGKYLEWYSDGQEMQKSNYVDGKRNGVKYI
jgi:antitoxin component YwqK of YwqJK toxin-antitoxin module